MEAGTADFIAKPVVGASMVDRVEAQPRVKRVADALRRFALIDALTGVANRRRFNEELQGECSRAHRGRTALALLMVDVDHFKAFNNRYGYPAGDACLQSVAKALQGASSRPADLVARYGGEEFAILLLHTPRTGAEQLANAVVRAIETLGLAHEASPTAAHVTVSVGISCYDAESDCWWPGRSDSHPEQGGCTAVNLLDAADSALDAAKHAGRARAMLLDVGHVGRPELACDIAPHRRDADRSATTPGRPSACWCPPDTPSAHRT